MLVDPACVALARHFLADELHRVREEDRESCLTDLAEAIQEAVEDHMGFWFHEREEAIS